MNVFTGIGRAGRDAEVRHTSNGKQVMNVGLAIDSGFGDNKQTTWLDCSAWGERFAKVAEYIKKGDRVGVSGEIGTREHDGKTYVTLNIREVTLLTTKQDSPQRQESRKREEPRKATGGSTAGEDDSIPFAPLSKRTHW